MQFFGKKIDFSLGEERTRLLICMCISLLIWTVMKLSSEFDTTRQVELRYTLPSMVEFVQPPPKQLSAKVNGTGLSIIGNYLRNPNPAITLDLRENTNRNIERGELLAALEDQLRMNVIDLDRNYLSILVDSMLSKKVPVKLEHDLKFAPDHFPIGPISLSYDSVFVSGTPDQLGQIFEVFTEKITSPSLNEDWTKTVKLIKPLDSFVQLTPDEITLTVEIEKFTEKTFSIPVGIPDMQDSIQLIPAEVNVKCVVPMSHYASFQASELEVEADLIRSVELALQNSVPVKCSKIPIWVRSMEIIPPTVEYFIVH